MRKTKIIEKKPLNVAQCVEILLREGVDKRETWMTVQRYEEPVDDLKTMEWKRLYAHHLAECAFLRDVIAELREQVLALDEQLDRPSDAKVST